MAGFTINKVYYGNNATVNQNFRIERKAATDPDSAYMVISAVATADLDGDLLAPLVVSGLPADTLYYIRSSNNCASPREYYIQQTMSS